LKSQKLKYVSGISIVFSFEDILSPPLGLFDDGISQMPSNEVLIFSYKYPSYKFVRKFFILEMRPVDGNVFIL
jgi:hypothetical protein